MIEKIIWRDEVLAPFNPANAFDTEPRYNIIDKNGKIVSEAARINLLNVLETAGTALNAENMNQLMQKCDAVGSFYYKPGLNETLYDFEHVYNQNEWFTCAAPPASLGKDAVVVYYGGKFYVTLGKMADGRINYDVAIYNPDKNEWQISFFENAQLPLYGVLEDFRLINGILYVAIKSTNDELVLAWLNEFDLEKLVWNLGETNSWPKDVSALGPFCISSDGDCVFVAGQKSGEFNWCFFSYESKPKQNGALSESIIEPVSLVLLGKGFVITTKSRQMFYSENFEDWRGLSHPNLSVQNGYLIPVKSDYLSHNHGVLYVSSMSNMNTVFYLNNDLNITIFNVIQAVNPKLMTKGGNNYYYPVSLLPNAWMIMRNFHSLSIETGNITMLSNSPENLTDYALGATEGMVLAVTNQQAILGRFSVVKSGVVVGKIFRGLSLAVTLDVFLVNERRTLFVHKGSWRRADDDYLICVKPENAVFGQIVNI